MVATLASNAAVTTSLPFSTTSLLRRATSTDAVLPEGLQLESLVKSTYEAPHVTCPAMVEFLSSRLQRNHGAPDPVVKLKCLRVLRHCTQKGRPEFATALRKHSSFLRELLSYNCAPDPVLGATPAKDVRNEAQMCVDALYERSNENSTSATVTASGFFKYRAAEGSSVSAVSGAIQSDKSSAYTSYRPQAGRCMDGFGSADFHQPSGVCASRSNGSGYGSWSVGVGAVSEVLPEGIVQGFSEAASKVAQYLPTPVINQIENLGRLPVFRNNQTPSLGADNRTTHIGYTSFTGASFYQPPCGTKPSIAEHESAANTTMTSTVAPSFSSAVSSPQLVNVVSLIDSTCAPTTSARPQLTQSSLLSFVRRITGSEIGRSASVPFLLAKLSDEVQHPSLDVSAGITVRSAVTWQAKVRVMNCLWALCVVEYGASRPIVDQNISTFMDYDGPEIIRHNANRAPKSAAAARDLLEAIGIDSRGVISSVPASAPASTLAPAVDLLNDNDAEDKMLSISQTDTVSIQKTVSDAGGIGHDFLLDNFGSQSSNAHESCDVDAGGKHDFLFLEEPAKRLTMANVSVSTAPNHNATTTKNKIEDNSLLDGFFASSSSPSKKASPFSFVN